MSSSNNAGSGSDGGGGGGGGMEEKKRRRMVSNRESARRSRQRKQEHLDGLIKQVGVLRRENGEVEKKSGEVAAVFAAVEAQNRVLRKEKERLAARLEALESVIEIAKVVRGSAAAGENVNGNGSGDLFLYEVDDDPMMKPWQLPCPSVPIIASSGLGCFKFEP